MTLTFREARGSLGLLRPLTVPQETTVPSERQGPTAVSTRAARGTSAAKREGEKTIKSAPQPNQAHCISPSSLA